MLSRAVAERALLSARTAAYPPGEYVGQEGFMLARDIVTLARQAGVGSGTEVLDLCCGSGGPGRHLARELGCRCAGVDESAEMITLARERTGDLPVRYTVATVPPVPAGRHDVVLLLETMLAFRDKRPLLAGIADVLRPGGRFACTVEEGEPLTLAEQAVMPHADTVWPIPLAELTVLLGEVGLTVTWQRDETAAHRRVVDAVIASFGAHRPQLVAGLGAAFLDGRLAAHRLWSEWLRTGRIRKYALVARNAK